MGKEAFVGSLFEMRHERTLVYLPETAAPLSVGIKVKSGVLILKEMKMSHVAFNESTDGIYMQL